MFSSLSPVPGGEGRVRGILSQLAQQAAEAGNGPADAGHPQGLPQTRLVAADHRLAEITLEHLEHCHRGQPGAAQEDGLGVAGVGLTREQIRALLALGVDVLDVGEPMIAGDLEARAIPVSLALGTACRGRAA